MEVDQQGFEQDRRGPAEFANSNPAVLGNLPSRDGGRDQTSWATLLAGDGCNGESSSAMVDVQEFIADRDSRQAIATGKLPVNAGMNSMDPNVNISVMEVDNLSINEIAGHSTAMEAAVTGLDVAEMQDNRNCTSDVCANAAVSKAEQFGQIFGESLNRNRNDWLRPKYVAFEHIEKAGPVKLDRIASLNSINKLDKGLVSKLLGRRLPFAFLNAELRRR